MYEPKPYAWADKINRRPSPQLKIRVGSRTLLPQVHAYEVIHGEPLPSQYKMVRECGTRNCINPHHFRLVYKDYKVPGYGTLTSLVAGFDDFDEFMKTWGDVLTHIPLEVIRNVKSWRSGST